jgi:hypothetical protein
VGAEQQGREPFAPGQHRLGQRGQLRQNEHDAVAVPVVEVEVALQQGARVHLVQRLLP